MLNLMRDIARAGLSTNSILASPTPDGKWIVRDGNRRVTALKLLNQPDLVGDPTLTAKIRKIVEEATAIPTTVDVYVSSDEDALRREMVLRHTGELEGVGQVRWSPYLRTLFLLDGDEGSPDRRAAQYALWAEKQGLIIGDDFPITTLTRLLDAATLEALGFRIEEDDLICISSNTASKTIANRIINDLASGVETVNTLFTPAQQEAYVFKIRRELGLDAPLPVIGSIPPTPPSKKSRDSGALRPSSNKPAGAGGEGRPDLPTPRAGGRLRKPTWERPHLFPSNRPGFDVPKTHSKAYNLVGEIQKLKVSITPIAIAVLMRALIECSEAHFREVHGLRDQQYLNKNILSAAKKMGELSLLTRDQVQLVTDRASTEGDWLNIRTLQKYVHSPDFHPNQQVLNTFWDEVSCFVAVCWRTG